MNTIINGVTIRKGSQHNGSKRIHVIIPNGMTGAELQAWEYNNEQEINVLKQSKK